MSVSTIEEYNEVKNYYNRTRGNMQAMKKKRNLAKSLTLVKERRGHETFALSPLNPFSERNAEEDRRIAALTRKTVKTVKTRDPYNHLTEQETRNMKNVIGGRRTRRHRERRRR